MLAHKPTKTVTILSGTSLSGEVILGSHRIVAIIMPAAWTAANLTFQAAAVSGGTFQDIYDDAGTEVSVTAAQARSIPVSSVLKQIGQFEYIKIRSGTVGVPVAQAADRVIILVLSEAD